MIDIVEPFQPLDPADAPKAGPAVDPGAFGGWPSQFLSPFAVDTASSRRTAGCSHWLS